MSNTKFIAELAKRIEFRPELSLASCRFPDAYHTAIFLTGEYPTTGYWVDWGGYYDHPKQPNVAILMNAYLPRVFSEAALTLVHECVLNVGYTVHLKTELKPWQYFSYDTETNQVIIFGDSPHDQFNPFDIYIEDELGNFVECPLRLETPTVSSSLPDNISGIVLYESFSLSFINNDGFFDLYNNSQSADNFFNTPVNLKRSQEFHTTLADYSTVRLGFIESMGCSFTTFNIVCATILRTLTQAVTKRVSLIDYPLAPDASVGRSIPIGYGSTLKKVPLIVVGTNKYLSIDKDYLSTVSTVYDASGASISFTLADGIITSTNADSADVVCLYDLSIGGIITREMTRLSNIPYIDEAWNLTETDDYIANSAKLNIFFNEGDLRSFVVKCLESDTAFLLQLNDGRLTLRQYGQIYGEHTIESWQLRYSQQPEKDTRDGVDFYISSAVISYNKNNKSGDYESQHLHDDNEKVLDEIYRKTKRVTFQTDLQNDTAADNLGVRLLLRYGQIPEKLQLSIAYNTSNINLLDTVNFIPNINGRIFSNNTRWIVTKHDPATDNITLESLQGD